MTHSPSQPRKAAAIIHQSINIDSHRHHSHLLAAKHAERVPGRRDSHGSICSQALPN